MELTVKNHHRAMYDARPGPGEEVQLGQGERNEGRESGHHMQLLTLIKVKTTPRGPTKTFDRHTTDRESQRHAAYCTLVLQPLGVCKGLPMHMSREMMSDG